MSGGALVSLAKQLDTPRAAMNLQAVIQGLPRPLRRQRLLSVLCRSGLVSAHQRITFNGGASAWVDLRDADSRAVFLNGESWPEFPPMVAAFLRSGGDLFDVGANFGLVTFGTVPLLDDYRGALHLFEANADIIPALQLSVADHSHHRFIVNQCCVTDEPGASRHTRFDGQWSRGGIVRHGGRHVRNLALDDYVVAHQVGRVGFLKVDVEGWELHVLRGARRALREGRIAAGYIEVAQGALARAGTDIEAVLAELEASGFDLYFAALWDTPDPLERRWWRADVNGTSLRFANARPFPPAVVQSDVLVIHRTTPLADAVREAAA